MDIGLHSWQEFFDMVQAFHGYPAPGVLIGGYMVAAATAGCRRHPLRHGRETRSCLPDAIQLLTPCSVGNGWLRILPFGRYALSLYDKYSGEGWRVFVDPKKLRDLAGDQDLVFKAQAQKRAGFPPAVQGNRSGRRLYLQSKADPDAAPVSRAPDHREDNSLSPMPGSLSRGRWRPLPRLPGRNSLCGENQ